MPERHSNRKIHIAAILLLFLLAPIHFIHLFPHFNTHILGDVMDAAEYPLREWWTAHALLDLKTNPFKTDFLFYPVGVNLVQHPYPFLDGLLYTVFRPLVPLLVFHNAMTWLVVFANSLAAYLLLFTLTGLPGLAFLGALAFAHSPVLTSYYGPQNLIEAYLLVFFVFAAHRLFQGLKFGWAVGSGILLGLSIYNYPYYFVAGLVWLVVSILYRIFPWTITDPPEDHFSDSFWTGRIWVWLILILTATLVLIPKDLWNTVGIGGRLRTAVGVGMVLLLYILTRVSKAVFAPRKVKGGIPFSAKQSPPVPQSPLSLKNLLLPAGLKWERPSGKEIGRVLICSALVLVTAALVAFPYTQSYLIDGATRSAIRSLPLDFIVYSVDLTGFLTPFHPWLADSFKSMGLDWISDRPIVATPAFLGYFWIVLLGIGFGLFFRRPELRVWIGGWLVFLFICLGPYLKIHGLAYTSFILPGILIPKLPLLENTRTLSRFLVPLVLITLICGCLLLKTSLSGISRGRRFWFYAGLAVLIGFEFALWPTPFQAAKTNYQVPKVYQVLAEQSGGKSGVLLDLPLFTQSGTRSEGRGETRTHFFQTIHQQRLIGGFSSKLDDRVFAFFSQLPGIKDLWSRKPITREELAGLLYALDVDWIILKKRPYEQIPLAAYRDRFSQAPYIKPFYEDNAYWGWRVDRDSAALEQEALAYWSVPGVLQRLIYPAPAGESTRAMELIIPPRLFSRIRLQFPPEALENLKSIKMVFRDYRMVEVPLTEFPAAAGSTIIPKELLGAFKTIDRPVKLAVIPEVRSSAKKLPAFQFQLGLKP